MALTEKLTDIADAIRLKRDIVTPLSLEDMALQVSLIDGGGGGGTDYSNLNAYLSVDNGEWIEIEKIQPNWDNALYNEINNTFERDLYNWDGVLTASNNYYTRFALRFKDVIRNLTFQTGQSSFPTQSIPYLSLGNLLRAGGGYESSPVLVKGITTPKQYIPVLGDRDLTVSADMQVNAAETVINTYTHVTLAISGQSSHDRCCHLGNFELLTPIVSNPSEKHNIKLKFTW